MTKTTHTIDDETAEVLERSTIDGHRLHLPRQLQRKAYERVAKVIEMLGGKWVRGQKCHVFEGDAGDRVTEAVMTRQVTDMKKLLQFYTTPTTIADYMVMTAGIEPWMSVLEPSAGDGALLKAVTGQDKLKGLVADFYELDQGRYEALVKSGAGIGRGLDFMGASPSRKYDRIIANPPFSGGQDVRHVRKMWELLAPAGRLVTITSPGWRFRETEPFASFRKFVVDNRGIVEPIPEGAFAAAGTNIRTILVVLDKPSE